MLGTHSLHMPQEEASMDTLSVLVEQKLLLRALSHQQNLVEKKTTIPILSHVCLEASEGKLSIKGTDLEMSLVETLPAQVDVPGKITVFAHIFKDLVRKFSDREPISLRFSAEKGLCMQSGLAKFVLPTLPWENFPKLEYQAISGSLMLNTKQFSRIIDSTYFCMSLDEARYCLNGIYFHSENEGEWRAIATDAHRLALSCMSIDPAEEGLSDEGERVQERVADAQKSIFPSLMIGRKTIQEFRKLLEQAPEEVRLDFSSHHVVLSFEGVVFSSRLIEAQFPDYKKAIPIDNPFIATLPVASFSESMGRMSMMSAEKQKTVELIFSTDRLQLFAQSQQYGSGTEEIAIQYQGPELKIKFNPQYLLDIFQNIRGSFAHIHLKDALSTVVFKDAADDQALYVLMPMR
jgi:DNA polymerase III subunit beta